MMQRSGYLWQARSHEWGMLELNAALEAKHMSYSLARFWGIELDGKVAETHGCERQSRRGQTLAQQNGPLQTYPFATIEPQNESLGRPL